MRLSKTITAVAVAALLTTTLTTPAEAAAPSTTANATSAMHDESLAYADYSAWANQADSVGNHTMAVLLDLVAAQERDEHFAELAGIANTVGPTKSNLLTAANGEGEEATRIYPGFQAQAAASGDTVTAALFGELAGDEASHRAGLLKAHRAICGHGPRPVSPEVDAVRIVEQPAQTSGQTLANVRTAMRGEAYASARYRLFAQKAYADGYPWLGEFYTTLADVELTEHYAALANRYGLIGPISVNLTSATSAETGAVAAYTSFSGQATAVGDVQVASKFAEIGTDETAHKVLFSATLGSLG